MFISIHAQKVFLIMRLKKRAFVEKLDFLTSPGHLTGKAGEREALGIPGSGPQLLVSDMGIFHFDGKTGEMTLTGLHPGVTVEEVQEEISWTLKVSPDLKDADAPSTEQLRIIRKELDPDKTIAEIVGDGKEYKNKWERTAYHWLSNELYV